MEEEGKRGESSWAGRCHEWSKLSGVEYVEEVEEKGNVDDAMRSNGCDGSLEEVEDTGK